MNILLCILAGLFGLTLLLLAVTHLAAWRISRRHPPVGSFADVNGARIHYVHVPGPSKPGLPPIVFIHGASANLKDQLLPLRPLLEGRAELLFLDRPGHGWSTRGGVANATQSGQAATIAGLMEMLGIDRTIVVAHSFGASIATAFALEHRERTAGLVFLAAATHPWPGGRTSWYYHLVVTPLLGRIFSELLTLPAGLFRLAGATRGVFAPNPVPTGYTREASIPLVLRPATFRANAVDVQSLYPYALATAPRYGEIDAPTVVISGNRDTVVYEELHSIGLSRDIKGAELLWIDNLGHKPDWVAPDLVVAAIEKLAGKPRDLQALARQVEARIRNDRHGAGSDYDPDEPPAQIPPLTQ